MIELFQHAQCVRIDVAFGIRTGAVRLEFAQAETADQVFAEDAASAVARAEEEDFEFVGIRHKGPLVNLPLRYVTA